MVHTLILFQTNGRIFIVTLRDAFELILYCESIKTREIYRRASEQVNILNKQN